MTKEETQKEIGKHLTVFAEATDANGLAGSINGITKILQDLKIDDRQKDGVNLLIGLVQQTLKDAALLKIQNKYQKQDKDNVAISVSYVIPEVLGMAIFE
jgi:hypothetical protein